MPGKAQVGFDLCLKEKDRERKMESYALLSRDSE